MKIKEFSYRTTQKFSPLVLDYIEQSDSISDLYNLYPSIENFEEMIEQKSQQDVPRKILVQSLERQNSSIELSELSSKNIQDLAEDNTYCITTGHQLCLFMGPLYFVYKIISTINLAEQLKKKYPTKNFVPIFWMASEDHDFAEINHVHLFGKKYEWNKHPSGAVGRMSLDGLDKMIIQIASTLGDSTYAEKLIDLFTKAYQKENLTQATRLIINHFFGKYGLVIIDGDDSLLKQELKAIIEQDVTHQSFYESIKLDTKLIERNYKSQAYVQPFNFFKLEKNKRIKIKEKVSVKAINTAPETFSPNVLMRPLYQELLLPNLAYVGGGGELSYWMQLKSSFKQANLVFPILILRNSALLLSSNQRNKLLKLGITEQDLFNDVELLKKSYILTQEGDFKNTDNEQVMMKSIFENLKSKFHEKAYVPMIDAEYSKQKKALQSVVKKILKMEKLKHKSAMEQIEKLKSQLFPYNSLQERVDSFIPFYLKYGDNFIENLKNNLDPLNPYFVVLEA